MENGARLLTNRRASYVYMQADNNHVLVTIQKSELQTENGKRALFPISHGAVRHYFHLLKKEKERKKEREKERKKEKKVRKVSVSLFFSLPVCLSFCSSFFLPFLPFPWKLIQVEVLS